MVTKKKKVSVLTSPTINRRKKSIRMNQNGLLSAEKEVTSLTEIVKPLTLLFLLPNVKAEIKIIVMVASQAETQKQRKKRKKKDLTRNILTLINLKVERREMLILIVKAERRGMVIVMKARKKV